MFSLGLLAATVADLLTCIEIKRQNLQGHGSLVVFADLDVVLRLQQGGKLGLCPFIGVGVFPVFRGVGVAFSHLLLKS